MRASEFIWENFADSKNQQLVRAYHGNQGGIDVEDLVTPMWFTTSREDAEYYAGDDGYVVVVDLDIKNPYMIQVGVNNPHSALDRWKELQSQGYDGIYDRRLGDWIPFSKEQIRVIGVNNMLDENSADGEASGGLPVKTLKGLYHVGTLDASKKRDGYEGAGLSVSTHPDAWERIARGHVTGDTYSATKEGNRFLDAHSLTKKHNAEITQWAIKNGYLEQQETVTVCYYDDEMEDNLCQTFDSMADAKNEYDDELQYMDVTVDKDGIVPTEKLKKETRQTRMSATGILEYVLPIFAEQQGLDGVWWQDKLDVQRYSAPRGVIVPSKIKSWKFTVNENFKVITGVQI